MTPEHAREVAVDIVKALRDGAHVAYLAGGCVRDELLGEHPKDYDVATDARPDRVQALFRRTQSVGASFGVMLVHQARVTVEVATFRRDGPYSDARRPDHIEFANAQSDARRRDFTINALFLDPLVSSDPPPNGASSPGEDEPPRDVLTIAGGRVIDYVGGLGDMKSKTIRAVGDPDARLSEDHLRALRAVRFASRLGFSIDDQTAQAIQRHATELRGVSRERIGDEIRRMIRHPSRAVAAWTLQYLGLDEPIFGKNTTKAPKHLGRLDDSTPYSTCLAAWAIDRGSVIEATQIAGLVAHWRTALCLSNEERDAVKSTLVGTGILLREFSSLGVAGQKRAAASDWFHEALRLVAAESPESMVRIHRRVDQLASTPSGLSPPALLSGDDLVSLGFRSGPGFQKILDGVYDAQLEDRVADKDEALTLARELSKELGI